MSIADEIRKMNNSFLATKTQETLKEMPLEKLAEEWHSVDAGLKKDAQSENNTSFDDAKYQQEKKEIMEKLAQVITPEELQTKLDHYLVSLTMNDFDTADFHDVSSFLDTYSAHTNKDELKNKVESIKNKIAAKRLSVEKPVDLNIAKENLGYTNINIEADKEIVGEQTNPQTPNGKTITFRNKQGKDIAGVEFDKDGNADILLPDEHGNALHYRITKDGKFLGEVNNTLMHEIKPEDMTPSARQALNMANEAKNIWGDYAAGNLDDKIIKDTPVTVNEGAEDEGTKVNEQDNEIDVNQDTRQSSKVNEHNPLINLNDPTKISQGEGQKPDEKKEAPVTGDELNQPTHRPDEVYWKEDDVIDTMFRWLVDGANAATNFVVHRIEDVAFGIWSQFNKELLAQKEEKEKLANSTQRLEKEMKELHNAKNKKIKKNCKKENIDKLLEQGNIAQILNENPAFAALYEQTPHLRQLMTPENLSDKNKRTETTTVISSMITIAESFSNNYALASMMDEKIHNKSAFNNEDKEEIYKERQKEGIMVFLRAVNDSFVKNKQKADPNKSNAEIFTETLEQISKKAEKAKENNDKAIKNGKYDENKQTPDTNVALFQLQQFAPKPSRETTRPAPSRETPEPENLRREAEDARRAGNAADAARSELDQQEAVLDGREQENDRRRDRTRAARENINHHGHEQTETSPERQEPPTRPILNRDGGR